MLYNFICAAECVYKVWMWINAHLLILHAVHTHIYSKKDRERLRQWLRNMLNINKEKIATDLSLELAYGTLSEIFSE